MIRIPRYRVGRELVAIDTSVDEVVLEGRHRLRPGHLVQLSGVPVAHGVRAGEAMVECWAIARLGSDGPVYRGRCRWRESSG